MPIPVTAPPTVNHSLGSLLTTADILNSERLIDGVSWRPELCAPAGIVPICPSPTGPVEKTHEEDYSLDLQTAEAYGLWVSDTCGTLPGEYDILRQRVRNRLENVSSFFIEEEFSTTLADGATPVGTGGAGDGEQGIIPALYAIVAALNQSLNGVRGFLHVPQQVVPYLSFYGMLDRFEGNRLFLKNTNHLVVTGTGYTGDAPDTLGGDNWIYGTGPVRVVLSSIFLTPDTEAGAIDRSTNDIVVFAERAAAVMFDHCAHVGAPVCLPDPGPPCGT